MPQTLTPAPAAAEPSADLPVKTPSREIDRASLLSQAREIVLADDVTRKIAARDELEARGAGPAEEKPAPAAPPADSEKDGGAPSPKGTKTESADQPATDQAKKKSPDAAGDAKKSIDARARAKALKNAAEDALADASRTEEFAFDDLAGGARVLEVNTNPLTALWKERVADATDKQEQRRDAYAYVVSQTAVSLESPVEHELLERILDRELARQPHDLPWAKRALALARLLGESASRAEPRRR